jgi:hypothetical protein
LGRNDIIFTDLFGGGSMPKKSGKFILILFVMLLIIIACTCSGSTPTMSISNRTIQQTQSQNNQKPTNSTVESGSPTQDIKLVMSMTELFAYVEGLTQLQRPDFLKSIDGKIVDWKGLVNDVQSDGSILIEPPSGRCFVNLSKVSMEEAKTVKKGTNIGFTGTILEPTYDDYIGLCILLQNVKIKSK